VTGDGGGAGAVEPELLALLGADGDEAFGAAGVGHADDFGGGGHHRVLVVADDVADQHHLGPPVALGLGGVAHRLHVALVQVLQAGQQHAGGVAGTAGLEVVGDLDDGGHGFAHLAEELQAHGAGDRRHLVQHPARGDDEAVGAFLLHAGHAAQELVGHVLAEAVLAAGGAGQREDFFGKNL
jgi:hypothetical protein